MTFPSAVQCTSLGGELGTGPICLQQHDANVAEPNCKRFAFSAVRMAKRFSEGKREELTASRRIQKRHTP